MIRSFLLAFILLLPWVASPSYSLQVHDSLIVFANSDRVYHGSTETAMRPEVGVALELQLGENVFVGGSFQEGRVRNLRQRHRVTTGYAGYGRSWLNWYGALSYRYRTFSDSDNLWNYAEWNAIAVNDYGLSLSVDYAPKYYHSDTEAIVPQIGLTRPLSPRWYWRGNYGAVELSNEEFFDNRFANITLGYSVNKLALELGYHWNSEKGHRFMTVVSSPDVVASITYKVR